MASVEPTTPIITCRVRSGLILHISSERYAVAIDDELLTVIDGLTFIAMDFSSYQVRKHFGFEKGRSGNSNQWLTHIKKLREKAVNDELQLAFGRLDDDCQQVWKTSMAMRKRALFANIPKVVEIPITDGRGGSIIMRVVSEPHHNTMLKFEATADNLQFIINTFYLTALVDGVPSQGARTVKRESDYPEYPAVRIAWKDGSKRVVVNIPAADGRKKKLKVIPESMSMESELTIVAQLQADHNRAKAIRGADDAVDSADDKGDAGDCETPTNSDSSGTRLLSLLGAVPKLGI
jgi:hypothetical protein